MMRLMDEHILEKPTAGVLTMQPMLADKGYNAGFEPVRQLMRKAAIMPIYPRRHLTQLGEKYNLFYNKKFNQDEDIKNVIFKLAESDECPTS